MSATRPRLRGNGPARVGTRSRRTTTTGTASGVPPGPRAGVDARALAAELIREVAGEVRFSDASRALYASDLSLYRQVPIGVVIPKRYDDVEATLAACRRHGAPILGRGCGTSLLGQCCNVAVVLDFSKYLNRILEIDPERRIARVQPGVINDQLRFAAEEHGLTFAPDPATHDYCTIGGQIGNNSCCGPAADFDQATGARGIRHKLVSLSRSPAPRFGVPTRWRPAPPAPMFLPEGHRGSSKHN